MVVFLGLGEKMFGELCKIKYDYIAALGGSRKQVPSPYKLSRKLIVLMSFELFVVVFFRIYSQLYRSKLFKPLSLLFYQLSKFILKCDIHPGVEIEGGFHLVHGFNVIIGSGALLGANVCLFDGVSIGKKNVGVNDGMPNIGCDVIVGSGAKVLGDIVIEGGVVIGANSVVIKSILEVNATVAGVPAKIIDNGK